MPPLTNVNTGQHTYIAIQNNANDKNKYDKESNFINNSKPISIRVHTLDLMPGIGKKNMEAILKERDLKPFESLADVHKRISSIADPIGIFVNRIISELEGKEKYYLFTKPPFTGRNS